MSKKPKYGCLNLLRDQIEIAVIAFLTSKDVEYECGELINVNGTRNRINFKIQNLDYRVDFHYNKDGTTTIDLSPGGYHAVKEELAEFIKNSSICQEKEISKFDRPYFVFEKVTHSDFCTIIDLNLKTNEIFKDSWRNISGGEQWVLKSVNDETVIASYFYKSQKAMIQGKPLKLFTELYTSLLTLIEVEEIPKIMNQQLNISKGISKDAIEKELELYLPNAIDKISYKIKNFCCQALMNLKVTDEMFDYSFLAFPSLRVLEGHLKGAMSDKGIDLIDGKFSMFTLNENRRKYALIPEVESEFTVEQKQSVEDGYNYYNNKRHSLFHWAALDGPIKKDRTRMMERIDEAYGYINDVFSIIDNYYK